MTRSLIVMLIIPISFALSSCGKSAANIYMRKGKEYYQKKDYQTAIRFFDKVLEVDANNNDAKFFRALSFYELGHHFDACEQMSMLIKSGYGPADSSLTKMGCYYYPPDSISESTR